MREQNDGNNRNRSSDSIDGFHSNKSLNDNQGYDRRYTKNKSIDIDMQEMHEQIFEDLKDIAPGNEKIYRSEFKRFET